MRKPNFRRIGQGFRAAGKKIAAVASAVRASVRNSREAQRAANEHLILTREEAKRRGLWPEHRRADNRKIMREVRKGGLSAVVQEMEKRRIDYHSRDYQPKEVKLIKKDGSVIVLTGLDAERARIPKLKQISRLTGERRKVLGECERIIEGSDLKRLVDNTRPKTLRQLSDTIGRVLIRRKPFFGEMREYPVSNAIYGEKVSISSAGLVTIEYFRDRRLINTEEHRMKPEEIEAFKEYHGATKRWHESLNEYSKQEWAEE
ncbi:MAG: hypothetical protein AABW72_05125 [archaeon]